MELQANARHSDARASCAYPNKYVEITERIEIRTYLNPTYLKYLAFQIHAIHFISEILGFHATLGLMMTYYRIEEPAFRGPYYLEKQKPAGRTCDV